MQRDSKNLVSHADEKFCSVLVALQRCRTGQLFFDGICDDCPVSATCDGSAAVVGCTPGSYLASFSSHLRKPICHQCPEVEILCEREPRRERERASESERESLGDRD